jgi:hypothetical protein
MMTRRLAPGNRKPANRILRDLRRLKIPPQKHPAKPLAPTPTLTTPSPRQSRCPPAIPMVQEGTSLMPTRFRAVRCGFIMFTIPIRRDRG